MTALDPPAAPAAVLTLPPGEEQCPAVGTLASLTGLRAVGALAVFAFHTNGYGDRHSPLWHVVDPGFIGVSFFFILSGLVLTWSAPAVVEAKRFYRNRAARIYPSHVVTDVVISIVYAGFWSRHTEPVLGLVLVLVLLQAWVPTVLVRQAGNGVSWSLSCEAFFYLLFPTLHRRFAHRLPQLLRLTAALLTLSLVGDVLAARAGGIWDVAVYENPIERLGEFVLGMTLAVALQQGRLAWTRPWQGWCALAVAWAGALGYAGTHDWVVYRGITDALIVAPMALLLAGYARRDIVRRDSWFTRPLMQYLGRISFAFYLVHQIAQYVVNRELIKTSHSAGDDLGRFFVSLALALVVAAAVHHWVELPGQRRFASRLPAPAARRIA